MPIRMDRDPEQDRQPNNNQDRNTGGGSSLLKFLPLVFMFLGKKPKILIPLLVIGGLIYFFGGSSMCNPGAVSPEGGDFDYATGASLDPERYDKVLMYEPLASGRNEMPGQVSLIRFAPKRLHQGEQGSCVGWASAYGARSILQSQATGKPADLQAFSPSFLYNHIALRDCQGSYLPEALEFMRKVGSLPLQEFPYNPRVCRQQASSSEGQRASQFRIRGYERLTVGPNNQQPDINGIRQHIAQGGPVVIGMQVGQSFMYNMMRKRLWKPTRSDYAMSNMGGHAMTVIGYDDSYQGGAFQLMNSWGDEWGEKGIAWVRYDDFNKFVKEAYGIYPMGRAEDPNGTKLAVQFGLVDVATGQYIPVQQRQGNVFATRNPIRKGDKFKAIVNNNAPCYIYIFGEETDKTSYVLYPYTPKHGTYFGVMGTRLFPSDYSMKADDLGTTDRIAMIFSKKELDPNYLNQVITGSRQSTFAGKVQDALGNLSITQASFNAGDVIEFAADVSEKPALAVVLELDKR